MTEEEWLKCRYPRTLYSAARTLTNSHLKKVRRKFRLYACACCRKIWPLLTEKGRAAVEASERYADGESGTADLEAARRAVGREFLSGENRAGQNTGLRPGAVGWWTYFWARGDPMTEAE